MGLDVRLIDQLRLNPEHLDLGIQRTAGMDQRFFDRHVGVLQLNVLADNGDLDAVGRMQQAAPQLAPVVQVTLSSLQSEAFHDVVAEPGVFEQRRHFVNAAHRGHRHHGAAFHVAEQGQLVARLNRNRVIAARQDNVRLNAHAA